MAVIVILFDKDTISLNFSSGIKPKILQGGVNNLIITFEKNMMKTTHNKIILHHRINNFLQSAHMKEKVLTLLATKFSGARKDGLRHLASILALQVTTEDEAKTLVDKLTKEQVDEVIKDFRADVDREVSESNKTFEENLKKRFDLVEKGKEDPKKKDDGNDDIASIVANAVTEAVKPFKEQLEKLEREGIAKTRLQQLEQELASCKDETFKAQTLKDFSRMTFGSDDEFTEYLSEKKTDITSANQSISDRRMSSHGRPSVPNRPNGNVATKEEVDDVVSRMAI